MLHVRCCQVPNFTNVCFGVFSWSSPFASFHIFARCVGGKITSYDKNMCSVRKLDGVGFLYSIFLLSFFYYGVGTNKKKSVRVCFPCCFAAPEEAANEKIFPFFVKPPFPLISIGSGAEHRHSDA